MRTRQCVSVIIPAKNEAGCVAAVLQEIPGDLVHEVLVIDGHSTDGTPELVRALGYQVIPQEGTGYGMAVSTGLLHATGPYITFMDADGSYDPEALPKLVEQLEAGNDVAFCSRYLPGSGSEDDTPVRFLGNKLFTFLLRLLHGVALSDALFLYVLAKREVFEKIEVRSRSFDWCIEFPIKVHRAGLKYTEIPSVERKRLAGISKVNAFYHGFRILWTMVRLTFTSD
jgi:glycosyltransferase involved in cell wall biosynthesis